MQTAFEGMQCCCLCLRRLASLVARAGLLVATVEAAGANAFGVGSCLGAEVGYAVECKDLKYQTYWLGSKCSNC